MRVLAKYFQVDPEVVLRMSEFNHESIINLNIDALAYPACMTLLPDQTSLDSPTHQQRYASSLHGHHRPCPDLHVELRVPVQCVSNAPVRRLCRQLLSGEIFSPCSVFKRTRLTIELVFESVRLHTLISSSLPVFQCSYFSGLWFWLRSRRCRNPFPEVYRILSGYADQGYP